MARGEIWFVWLMSAGTALVVGGGSGAPYLGWATFGALLTICFAIDHAKRR